MRAGELEPMLGRDARSARGVQNCRSAGQRQALSAAERTRLGGREAGRPGEGPPGTIEAEIEAGRRAGKSEERWITPSCPNWKLVRQAGAHRRTAGTRGTRASARAPGRGPCLRPPEPRGPGGGPQAGAGRCRARPAAGAGLAGGPRRASSRRGGVPPAADRLAGQGWRDAAKQRRTSMGRRNVDRRQARSRRSRRQTGRRRCALAAWPPKGRGVASAAGTRGSPSSRGEDGPPPRRHARSGIAAEMASIWPASIRRPASRTCAGRRGGDAAVGRAWCRGPTEGQRSQTSPASGVPAIRPLGPGCVTLTVNDEVSLGRSRQKLGELLASLGLVDGDTLRGACG